LLFKIENRIVADKIKNTIKIDQVTSRTLVKVQLRQTLNREAHQVIKPEDAYLLNEMKAYIYKENANVKVLVQEILGVIENETSKSSDSQTE